MARPFSAARNGRTGCIQVCFQSTSGRVVAQRRGICFGRCGTLVGGYGTHFRHLDEGRPVTNRVRGASHRCETRGNRRYDCSAAGPFRGIIASGLHTQAACFGQIIRSGWVAQVSMGGADQLVRWPAPVRPGDEIGISARIEALTPSRSKPDRGVVKVLYTGRRAADGVVVLEMLGTHIFRR